MQTCDCTYLYECNIKKIYMFIFMNVFCNIGVNKILSEVAATINERGDEPHLFRPF